MTIYTTDAYAPRNPSEEEDAPEVPLHVILSICQDWAENPPDWLQEKAMLYAVDYWEDHKEWP